MLLSAEVNRNFWIPDLVKDSMFRVAFIVNTTIYVTYTEHCICYNVSGLYAENKRVKKKAQQQEHRAQHKVADAVLRYFPF